MWHHVNIQNKTSAVSVNKHWLQPNISIFRYLPRYSTHHQRTHNANTIWASIADIEHINKSSFSLIQLTPALLSLLIGLHICFTCIFCSLVNLLSHIRLEKRLALHSKHTSILNWTPYKLGRLYSVSNPAPLKCCLFNHTLIQNPERLVGSLLNAANSSHE